jgi:hypothetical protein
LSAGIYARRNGYDATIYELWYQHFAFDPTMAPQGKTSLTVLVPSDLAWWEKLGYRNGEYKPCPLTSFQSAI